MPTNGTVRQMNWVCPERACGEKIAALVIVGESFSVRTCLFWSSAAPLRPSAALAGDWQVRSGRQRTKRSTRSGGRDHVPLFTIPCGLTEPTVQAVTAWPVPRKDKAIWEQRSVLKKKDTSVVAAQHPEQTSLLGRPRRDGAGETHHARS